MPAVKSIPSTPRVDGLCRTRRLHRFVYTVNSFQTASSLIALILYNSSSSNTKSNQGGAEWRLVLTYSNRRTSTSVIIACTIPVRMQRIQPEVTERYRLEKMNFCALLWDFSYQEYCVDRSTYSHPCQHAADCLSSARPRTTISKLAPGTFIIYRLMPK